jgi:hypothetical protein
MDQPSERYEVYEVIRDAHPQRGFGVSWTYVFSAGSAAALGVGLDEQAKDRRRASREQGKKLPTPHYAIYDKVEDWWIAGPEDPWRNAQAREEMMA